MRILSQKVFLLVLLFASTSCSTPSGESKYDGMDLFASKQEVVETKKDVPAKPEKKLSEKLADIKEKKIELVQPAKAADEAKPVVAEKIVKKTDSLKALNVNKIYEVEWVNMTVAYFVASVETSGSDVTFKFHSLSMGFVDKIANFGWSSLTKARFDGNDYTPVSVDRISELKKKSRNIKLSYDAKGNITSDVSDPPENRSKRPEVPQNEKNKTYDVLTLFLEARAQAIDIFKDKKFTPNAQGVGESVITLPLYDGRKRSDIEVTLYDKINNGQFKARVRQRAVSGYTQNERKDSQKGDKYVDLFVDSETFLPVKASGKSPLGSARASFKSDCTKTFEECIQDIEKKQ